MIRQKTLNQLLAALPGATLPHGDGGTLITALAFDSRKVAAGTLFIAVPGVKHDGHNFVRQVADAGAAAVVVQAGREGEFADIGVPVIVASDTRKAMAQIACAFYDNPTAKLHLAGVTGTNGKTTTALMMESIARANGDKTAYVGTLGFGIGGVIVEGERTTPEAMDLQAFFARCVDEGVTAVCMEVSSHALATGRTAGCLFDVAVFTNLTQDHLDFHGTMENYRDAKGILFGEYAAVALAGGKAFTTVLNIDDDAGLYYFDNTPATNRITFSTVRDTDGEVYLAAGDNQQDIVAMDDEVYINLIRYLAATPAGSVKITLNFGGSFNVQNSLAAVGYGVARGIALETIAQGLYDCPPVPGRFQPVRRENGKQPFAVIVDYAHTPDALDNVLRSARPLTSGKLISVSGCGGDRDKTKRPKMGRIAQELSDITIVTSDNPRTENPDAILDDVMAGMTEGNGGATVYREADRRKAIALAVSLAAPGDTIVIAGKGHETYQIVGTQTYPFDDVSVARVEIEARQKREGNL